MAKKKSGEPSDLEVRFARLWKSRGGPAVKTEYRFLEPRRFRFDFCHVPTKVAVEIEGGVWTRGRHMRPQGFINDCEKYNLAATAGFTVFRLVNNQITDEWIDRIIAVIRKRMLKQ